MNQSFFTKSAGVLLFLTGVAKLVASSSTVGIVGLHDPILGFQFKDEFLMFGLVEAAVASFCLLGRAEVIQIGLIAWLATCFAVYRIGLTLVGIKSPCPCLGTLPQTLHLSASTANAITLSILVYLLGGAYYGLFHARSGKRNDAKETAASLVIT